MRIAAVALIALALTGCADPQKERVEIADVNARNAIVKADELASRVEALETRVDELEAKLGE